MEQKSIGAIMKVGSLVIWKNIPYIGVVQDIHDGLLWIYWLDDGHESWEESRDLREVKDASR